MRRIAASVVLAILAVLVASGCGRADGSPPAASTPPASPTASPSPPANSEPAPATLNAWVVLGAFSDANLPVPNPRNNSAGCAELGCTQLVTTDAVSIYVWPDLASAKHAASVWGEGGHQEGLVLLSYTGARTPEKARAGYERILHALN